ncbi:MAG: hypothetical protein IJK87_07580 [Prevotella sp.]|nr:hypothetical protein [Prevotella sp.]
MKRTFLIIIGVITLVSPIQSQNLYYKFEVGTNNIYSFAIANLATGWMNALADRMLFDNAYTYTYLQSVDNSQGLKTRNYNITGITAREFFSDVTTGGKIGYQSSNPGNFNWGVFGSAHYRINQFKTITKSSDDEYHNDIQRLLLGGGLLLSYGDIESSTRFTFEAGLRYEMPMYYKGFLGKKSDVLNQGLSSHFAIRINGNGALQGLGVYADIPHYKLYKKDDSQVVVSNLRMYTFGIIYTITPWKIIKIYNL